MPAKDKYHDIVIKALQKEGWAVISDQVTLRIGDRRLWIDLMVQNYDESIILVEIKTYEDINSPVDFLQKALGQYLMYRAILDSIGHDEKLYLAIPEQANIELFQSEIGHLMVETYQLNLMIYDIYNERISKWTHNS